MVARAPRLSSLLQTPPLAGTPGLQVVKAVLLLTGSVEGIKAQVSEYIGTFDRYKFLWTQDLQVVAFFGRPGLLRLCRSE